MILLTVAAILVFFGVAQRVLDKLYLTDRAALLLIAIMFFGTLLPNFVFGSVSVNLGGAIIPAGICIYVLTRANESTEITRSVIGSIITAAVVYALSALMPDEPEALPVDPMYLYGAAGGLTAYLIGRSRRCAFICGVFGVLFADIAVGIVNRLNGIDQQLVLGGAGIFDAVVISGILGVLLAELIGEAIERLSRGNQKPAKSSIENPIKDKER